MSFRHVSVQVQVSLHVWSALLLILIVLHPAFGISWFRKVDPTGARARNAEVLFRHAFDGYKASEPAPVQAVARPSTDSGSSFLDDICMSSMPDILPTAPFSLSTAEIPTNEVDRFFQAERLFGKSDPRRPLQWWKVCFSPLIMNTFLTQVTGSRT